MIRVLFISILLLIGTIIPGPLSAVTLYSEEVKIYPPDLIVMFMSLFWIPHWKTFIGIVKKEIIYRRFLLFCLVAFISLLLSPIPLDWISRTISFLYLLRLVFYSTMFITVRFIVSQQPKRKDIIIFWLTIVSFILVFMGWLQYFLYPDLRNLEYLGWDPHYKRIFATYLDPNFFGLMLVLGFILISSITLRVLLLITILFTYSRSAYLSFLASLFFIGHKWKNGAPRASPWYQGNAPLGRTSRTRGPIYPRTSLWSSWHWDRASLSVAAVFITALLLLPRPPGVGVQLERLFSAQERVRNWSLAFEIFTKYPLFGTGFNTTRYSRLLIEDKVKPQNHALSGFDNSYLFVAATTGIVGLLAYGLFLFTVVQNTRRFIRASWVAVIIHALFLNSLFFLWVMIWLWVITGLDISRRTRRRSHSLFSDSSTPGDSIRPPLG